VTILAASAVLGVDAEAAARVAEWEDLAAHAVEPNIFYEPWFLRPALESLPGGQAVRLALVHSVEAGRRPLLVGLFPLDRRRPRLRAPVTRLALWTHKQCFLCTPLLREGHAEAALGALLEALAARREPAVLELELVRADGPFQRALVEVLRTRERPSYRADAYNRALLVPAESAEAYLTERLHRKRRKEFKRLESRLGKVGRLTYDALAPGADPAPWVEEFLALEGAGWKRATSLASRPGERRFFEAAVAGAHARGRLDMLAIRLDGRAVAAKCNFSSGKGEAFSFKIAYDEAYRQYSPGVLLELENIRRFHAAPGARWMDSCAQPDHPMANRIWGERRGIEHTLVATGRAPGDLAVSLLPLLRWAYRRVRRAPKGGDQA
ncbi:MAG TPA: GNAT family N-acetyltransferase, partial [Planctomycetota bacterium]|nr:GNAT family N-acetyltransferase [Planctomycetota bacterium]